MPKFISTQRAPKGKDWLKNKKHPLEEKILGLQSILKGSNDAGSPGPHTEGPSWTLDH